MNLIGGDATENRDFHREKQRLEGTKFSEWRSFDKFKKFLKIILCTSILLCKRSAAKSCF
jgi:hypothetical protein